MEQENDSYLNEKQNEVSARKEGELFHPPKNYVLQKTRIEARDQCVSNIGLKISHGYIMMKGTWFS